MTEGKFLAALVTFLLLLTGLAHPQIYFQTPNSSVNAPGTVLMCGTAAGAYVPCTGTPITASATGTAGAVTATLAGVAGKTTYICSVVFSSSGATAAASLTATITGTITGTLSFIYSQVAITANNQAPLMENFSPCVPASAVNAPIAASMTTGAGTTLTAVNATGFQL